MSELPPDPDVDDLPEKIEQAEVPFTLVGWAEKPASASRDRSSASTSLAASPARRPS